MGRHRFVDFVGMLALLAIILVGCGTKARTEKGFDESLVDTIVKGKTTKKEIVKNFGYPHEVIGSPDSVEYLYRSKGKGETLLVVFKDDVVVDYKLTTGALPEVKPALSRAEGPALSRAEGPALSKTEGPAPLPRAQEVRPRSPIQNLPQERASKQQEAAQTGEPFIKRFQPPPAKPAPAEAAPARAVAAEAAPAQAASGGDSQVFTLSLRGFDPNALLDLVEIQRRHKRSFILEVIGSADATQVQVRFEPQAVESVKELLDYLARPRQEGP